METNTDTTTTYSPRTGRSETCGVSDGRLMVAWEREDGTWMFRVFLYPTIDAARSAAHAAGF